MASGSVGLILRGKVLSRKRVMRLTNTVVYDVVFYRDGLSGIMTRLQCEFPIALQALVNKNRLDGPARVIKFKKSNTLLT